MNSEAGIKIFIKFAYLYPSFIHLSLLIMLTDLLQTSYFAIFLIVALGFMLGRIKVMGLSLDVSAVIFIALAFGHWGVSIPKELGTFGLVLFIFTIGIQAGPGFFHSFRSKGKTLILITLLIVASACLTGVGMKYLFDIYCWFHFLLLNLTIHY